MSLTSPKTSRKASPPSSCIQTPKTFIMASRPSYPPPPSYPQAAACHSLAHGICFEMVVELMKQKTESLLLF